jgi:hypothetical protein
MATLFGKLLEILTCYRMQKTHLDSFGWFATRAIACLSLRACQPKNKKSSISIKNESRKTQVHKTNQLKAKKLITS